jgi:undecaprenyl-diphosphatase
MITDLLLSGEGFFSLIEAYDKQLLLAVNGSDSLFLDRLVRTLTNAFTWVPFYVSMLWLVIRSNETVRKVLYVLLGAAICVLLAGSVDDLIVKPTVARWRPTHDPEIGMLVDIVDGYRGGRYGFFSAHAANTFSLATFFCWLVRSRVLSIAVVIWSFTNCWTRLYLGVHFPGDILVGLIWGSLVGSFAYFVYYRLTRQMVVNKTHLFSSHYTATGFDKNKVNVPVCILVFTLVFALIKATII